MAPARSSPELPFVERAPRPSAVDVRPEATYFLHDDGAVERLARTERTIITRVELPRFLAEESSRVTLSIGDDESVWIATRAGVGLWDETAWTATDEPPEDGVDWRFDLTIAARNRDDAWLVEYPPAGPRACHWDGAHWSCEEVALGTGAVIDTIALSDAFVWVLARDGSVVRRADDGTWSPVPRAVGVEELVVRGDDDAVVRTAETVSLWNGTSLVPIGSAGTAMGVRATDDVWIVDRLLEAHDEEECPPAFTLGHCTTLHRSAWRQFVVSHFDGVSVSEWGHVSVVRPVPFPFATPVSIAPIDEGSATILIEDEPNRDGEWYSTAVSPGCAVSHARAGAPWLWAACALAVGSRRRARAGASRS
jgi:hypothetical protein